MIGARQNMESRWVSLPLSSRGLARLVTDQIQRRLPFHLALESKGVTDDENMALECMKMILQDVFKSIPGTWDKFIDACYNHVSVLVCRHQ